MYHRGVGVEWVCTEHTSSRSEQAELAAWLVLIASGDESAFAALYRATASRMLALIINTVRDPGFAEDILSEVYLQVWLHAGDYRPERGKALSWLMTISKRRAIDRVRAEEVSRRHLNLDPILTARASPPADEPALREAEHAQVRHAMQVLTVVQRDSIDLVYFGGRTPVAAATELGIGLPALKTRIRDGIGRLRHELTHTA